MRFLMVSIDCPQADSFYQVAVENALHIEDPWQDSDIDEAQ